MTSAKFLGHFFDENGVNLSEQRVQGIREVPTLMSVSSVRSFVGMVNYFRDFILSLSSYLQPLTEILEKMASK